MSDFFVDRVVEHPARVTLTGVGSDSFTQADIEDEVLMLGDTAEVVADITRTEGEVSVTGTPLNAASMNEGVKSLASDVLAGRIIDHLFVAGGLGYLTIPYDQTKTSQTIVVIWRGAGSSSSCGIDILRKAGAGGASTWNALNLILNGTQLLSYSFTTLGDDDVIIVTSTAQSTNVHAKVIN